MQFCIYKLLLNLFCGIFYNKKAEGIHLIFTIDISDTEEHTLFILFIFILSITLQKKIH